MKRWLNLNGMAGKFLIAISILVGGIPAFLTLGSIILELKQSQLGLVYDLIEVSAAAGIVVLIIFVAIVALEQVLDRLLYRDYLKNRGRKMPLGNHVYECQYCGCRSVKVGDTSCPVCGRSFQQR
jgi:hypothetical protein